MLVMGYVIPVVLGATLSLLAIYIIKWVVDKKEHKQFENIRLLGLIAVSVSGPGCLYFLTSYTSYYELDRTLSGILFLVAVILGMCLFGFLLKPLGEK